MSERPVFHLRCDVGHTWSGEPIDVSERVVVHVALEGSALTIGFDAPAHGDPLPDEPAGSVPRLWEYEVVELMLVGRDEHYLEVELGPGGHFLVLSLHGTRNVVRSGMDIEYSATVSGGRWRGTASVPAALLPPEPNRINAFAVHGSGPARRYLCHAPTGGDHPDFHRLETFAAIVELSSRGPGS